MNPNVIDDVIRAFALTPPPVPRELRGLPYAGPNGIENWLLCTKPNFKFGDDPFANGWNAAMQHYRKQLPTPHRMPMPINVIFHFPATIVYWDDGDKTIVKCQPGDTFSAEAGLTAAMLKKYMGNDNTFNKVINEWLARANYANVPELPAATE